MKAVCGAVVICTLSALTAGAAEPPIYVIDGDTFIVGTEHVRIANIDAPEIFRPHCPSERQLGIQAGARLVALLAEGPPVIQRTGKDRDKRTLALISVRGRDVGDRLIGEGLAVPWRGHRARWCDRPLSPSNQ